MASLIVRRSLLYVPGSSTKMLAKSRGLTVDCIAYDLEDSVTPNEKPNARRNLRQLFNQPRPSNVREQAVRINSVGSGLAEDDLREVLSSPHIDAIVVPKVNSASDLTFVADVIKHVRSTSNTSSSTTSTQDQRHSPPLRLIALIESARSLINLPQICTALPDKSLSGLIFAAEDFALDTGITRTSSLHEFLYARSLVVTHARAFGLASAIDLVCTSYKGTSGTKTLEDECADGRRMGFDGKQLIHPSQVEVCHRQFSPSESEVEWAVRIGVAARKAEEEGRGAWTLDGKMVDEPVVGKARAVRERARACGIDVRVVEERWKEQEPE